ncbi:MAG: RHS repeat-associated core domain-containing protein [Actinomycetota bacterium]
MTIYAKDASGQTISDFEDTASLSDLTGTISPTVTRNTYVALDAGSHHSLSISSGGSLWAWGNNDQGQTNVPAGSDYAAVSGGANHSLALRTDGSLAGWGFNNHGQATPPAGNDFTAVAAGGFHSLALRTDGTLAGWGENLYGQATVPSGNGYAAVSAGFYHSLALRTDGTLAAWGLNNYGQTTVPAGNNYVAIAAGNYHCLALRSDGTIAGWGYNDHGQATPPAGSDFVAVSAGNYHSLALRSDGSLFAWGNNSYGQTTVPSGSDYTAISAGDHHCLALREDGTIAAWGYNGYSQTTVPQGHFTGGVFTGMVTIGAPYTSDVITAESDGKTGSSNAFTVMPLLPDFGASLKQVGTAEVTPQGTLAYSLQIINGGAGPATQVAAVDYLDSNLENITDISGGGVYDPGGHKITWELGTLNPLGQCELAFSAQVKATAAPGTVIFNQAQIGCAEANPYPTNTVQTAVVPGPVDHFAIAEIASPQTAGAAFPLAITALDAFGNTATSFSGSVNISDTTGTIAPTLSGAFTNGSWTGEAVIEQAAASCTVSVDDGAGHLGQSNSFQVIEDTTYPEADITYPTEGEVITAPSLMVTGTAYDLRLTSWQLTCRLEGTEDWVPLSAPHTDPVQVGDLETWDLSGLPDGIVHLRLGVVDEGGLSSEDIVSIAVERQDPIAAITWPEEGEVVGGTAQVTGSASDGNLLRYLLSYGEGTDPQTWHPIPPAPAGLEVAQETGSSAYGLYQASSLKDLGQVFRVSDGHLDRIELLLGRTGAADAEIGLKVCEVVSGIPTFNVVAESSTTYGFSQISTTATWYAFEFRGEELQPGTEYCIVLTRLDGVTDGLNYITWRFSSTDVYAGGAAWRYNVSAWSSWTSYDFAFRAYTYSEEDLYGYEDIEDGVLAAWRTAETPDGPYTLRLQVEDAYGKQAADQVLVEADRTPPLVQIISPQGYGYMRGTVDITGTATDSHFLSWQLFYGAGANPAQYLPLSAEMTAPVEEGTLCTWDTTALADGLYTIKLVAHDQATLMSETALQVTVDNTHPAASIASPAPGEAVCGMLFVHGEASDTNFASYSLRYTQDPDPDAPGAQWTEITSDTLPPGANLASLDTATMVEIPLWLELSASDKAGNTSVTRTNVNPDNTFPEVYISSPEEGRVCGEVRISGVAYDRNPASYSLYDWDGENLTTLIEDQAGGTGTAPTDLFFWNTSAIADGEHVLAIKATDAAGHERTAIQQVRVDNVPPSGNIQIMGKDATGEFTNTGFTQLKLNTVDTEYIKIWNYDAEDPDHIPEEAYLVQAGGGSYTGLLTRNWVLPSAFLNHIEGVKEVRCQFIDSAGTASAVYSDTVVFETTQPIIAVTSPARQSTDPSGKVHFDFSLSDPEVSGIRSGLERVEIHLTVGGMPLEKIFEEQLSGEDCARSADIDISTRGYGYYDFIIKAFDRAGNASASNTFSYNYAGYSEWPMAGYDVRNSRYNSGVKPDEMLWPYKIDWASNQGFGGYSSRGNILESDGYLYFSEVDHDHDRSAIRKIRISDGDQVAEYPINDPADYNIQGICLTGSGTEDGRVIVLTQKRVIVLNRIALEYIDSRDMASYYSDDGTFRGMPVTSGDFLYLPIYKSDLTNGSRMLAVNIDTLEKEWDYYATQNAPTRPALTEGKLIFACNPYLYVLDAATGLDLHPPLAIEGTYKGYVGVPTVYNNHIYLMTRTAYSGYALSIIEMLQVDDEFQLNVVAVTENINGMKEELACANGMVYVVSTSGSSPYPIIVKMWAFDAATGSTMWVKDFTMESLFGARSIGTPAIADGLLFVGFTDRPGFFDIHQSYLRVFDAYTGQLRYSSDGMQTTNTYIGNPTVTVSKGRAFFHINSSASVCFKPGYTVNSLNALGFDTFCGFYGGVNTSLGSFTQEITDVSLPGRCIDVEIKRTYNSYKPDTGYTDNGFGNGWDWSYNVYLEQEYDNSNPPALTALKVHRGDGRVDIYAKEGDTFKPPPGVFDDLVAGWFPFAGSGQTTLYTLKDASGKLWEFDTRGDEIRLVRIVDDHGAADNILTLDYEEDGIDDNKVDKIILPDGRETDIDWTGEHITSITYGNSYTVAYSYDGAKLASVTDIYGGLTQYAYNGEDRLQSITEPMENVSKTIAYYPAEDPNAGMVKETKDANNAATQFSYATTSHMTMITDPRGYTNTHRYDTLYRLIQEVNNAGESTTYSYGDDGNGKSVRDARGRITQYISEEGKVKRIVNPDGGIRDFTYDERDRLVSETDGAGHSKTYSYIDKDGTDINSVTSITDFGGQVTKFFYTDVDNPGLPTVKVMPPINGKNGPNPTMEYLYHDTGSLWLESLFEDWNENTSDPHGSGGVSFNRYEYDIAGRVTEEDLGKTNPLNQGLVRYSYEYDDNASDGMREVTKTNVSPDLGSVVEQPIEITRYDKNGRLAEAIRNRGDTSPDSHMMWIRTSYAYDGNNREIGRELYTSSETDPPLPGAQLDQAYSTATKAYFTNGLLQSESDYSGRTTYYAYDDAGRLAQQTDAAGRTTHYEYFADGQLQRRIDPNATGYVEYSYDDVGRLASEERRFISALYGEMSYKTQKTYDTRSNVTEERTTRPVPGPTIPALSALTYDEAVTTYTYDSGNRVLVSVSTTGEGNITTAYEYDPAGNKISETRTGPGLSPATTAYVYNALGKAIEEVQYCSFGTTSENPILTYRAYDTLGNITSETVCNGTANEEVLSHKAYTYNGLSKIKQVYAAVGAEANGFSLGTKANLGSLTTTQIFDYEYFADGLLSWETRYNLDGSGISPTQEITYSYDALEKKTRESWSVDETARYVRTYSYDGAGNVLKEEIGDGTDMREIAFEYDGANRTTKKILPNAGGETEGERAHTFEYRDAERKVEATDPEGRKVISTLDDLDRVEVSETTGEDGYLVLRAYDQAGGVIRESARQAKNPDGTDLFCEAFQIFDDMGRLTEKQVLSEGGGSQVLLPTTYAYDHAGNLVSTTTPAGATTTYTYDTLSRLRHQALPHDGSTSIVTSWAYDALSRKTHTFEGDTDPDTTRYTYDGLSQLRQVEQWSVPWTGTEGVYTAPGAPDAVTTYEVDLTGNLVSQTDAKMNTTSYTYDGCGWLTGKTDPLGRSESFTYTKYGETANHTYVTIDPEPPAPAVPDRAISYTYDGRGRLTAEKASDGTTTKDEIAYAYDHANNTTEAIYRVAGGVDIEDRSLDLAYDASGRISSVSSALGGAAGSYSTSYSYLDSGEIESRTLSYAEGGSNVELTSSYTYDISGRLTQASAPAQGGTYAFSWDADSRLTQVDLPSSGGHIDYTYYGEGLTATQTAYSGAGTPQASYDYAYNDRGQRSDMDVTLSGSYAALNGNYHYEYDGMGRLKGFNAPGEDNDMSYVYDECGNLVTRETAAVTETYTYDAANQIASGPDSTYVYDPFGNLIQKGTETMTYDGFDRLVTTSGTTGTVSFSYDPLGRLTERKVGEATERAFRYDGTSLSQAQETDGAGNATTTYALSPSGTHLAQDKGGTISYLGLNPHTDVSFTLGSQGSLTGALVYDPYGNPLANSDLDSSLGYQEDYTDPASGLVWMGARWYSPELARFLSVDPLPGYTDEPLSLNPYLYCEDDPMNSLDPLGTDDDDDSFMDTISEWVEEGVAAVTTVVFGSSSNRDKHAQKTNEKKDKPKRSWWQKVGGFFSDVWEGIKSGGKAIVGGVRKALHSVYNETKWYHHSNLWEGIKKAPAAAKGFVVGLGKGAYNTVKGTATGIYDLATGKISLSEFFSGIKQGFVDSWNKITDFELAARDPYAYAMGIGEITGSIETGIAMSAGLKYLWSNYASPALSKAWAAISDKFSGSALGSRLTSAFSGEGGYIGWGDNLDDISIETPRGLAYQEMSEQSLNLRQDVMSGGKIYRAGSFEGGSYGPRGQFWAPENPINTPGYMNKYGATVSDYDFVISGKPNPGAPFVTRTAPPYGTNIGGVPEVVVNPGDVVVHEVWINGQPVVTPN